jgi:hypothetical protein
MIREHLHGKRWPGAVLKRFENVGSIATAGSNYQIQICIAHTIRKKSTTPWLQVRAHHVRRILDMIAHRKHRHKPTYRIAHHQKRR